MLVLYENIKKHSAFTLPQVASAMRGRAFVFADFFIMEEKIKLQCKIENCNYSNRSIIKGYCNAHYLKLRKYGDPQQRKPFMNSQHYLRSTYNAMVYRCYDIRSKSYKNYGGRGITVSDRWLGVDGFSNFILDMGDRQKGMTLDRKDNSKGYSKENCSWVTWHQQQFNKRTRNENIGVAFDKYTGKWKAYITINRKVIQIGRFTLKEDAIKARKEQEIKYGITY